MRNAAIPRPAPRSHSPLRPGQRAGSPDSPLRPVPGADTRGSGTPPGSRRPDRRPGTCSRGPRNGPDRAKRAERVGTPRAAPARREPRRWGPGRNFPGAKTRNNRGGSEGRTGPRHHRTGTAKSTDITPQHRTETTLRTGPPRAAGIPHPGRKPAARSGTQGRPQTAAMTGPKSALNTPVSGPKTGNFQVRRNSIKNYTGIRLI